MAFITYMVVVKCIVCKVQKKDKKMKRLLIVLVCLVVVIGAVFAIFKLSDSDNNVISLSCVEYNIVAKNLSSENPEFVINEENVVLSHASENYWENDSWAFQYDANDKKYMLLDKSGGVWRSCGVNNLEPECDAVIENVNLECLLDFDFYSVAVQVCEDRAILDIGGKQYVLPVDRGFFENADMSFLSGDALIGFVVNPNDPENWADYGKYILKINGNEYPLCTVVE